MTIHKFYLTLALAILSLPIISHTLYSQASTFYMTELNLNAGLISNPGADISLLSFHVKPQWSLGDDKFRLGPVGGVFFNKDFEAVYGAQAMFRVLGFGDDGFISFGGLFAGIEHRWYTDDSKVMAGKVHFDLYTWFGVGLEYGRDYHYDRNWISLKWSFLIGGGDPDNDTLVE